MRTLPTTFHKNGFDFTQIERRGLIALFSKQKGKGVPWSFEVVQIQQHPAREIAGVSIPASEAMPQSKRLLAPS